MKFFLKSIDFMHFSILFSSFRAGIKIDKPSSISLTLFLVFQKIEFIIELIKINNKKEKITTGIKISSLFY
jgi:hypothetical protein